MKFSITEFCNKDMPLDKDVEYVVVDPHIIFKRKCLFDQLESGLVCDPYQGALVTINEGDLVSYALIVKVNESYDKDSVEVRISRDLYESVDIHHKEYYGIFEKSFVESLGINTDELTILYIDRDLSVANGDTTCREFSIVTNTEVEDEPDLEDDDEEESRYGYSRHDEYGDDMDDDDFSVEDEDDNDSLSEEDY